MAFVGESIEPGSVVHTDGWLGYEPLEGDGYRHEVSYLEGQSPESSKYPSRNVVAGRQRQEHQCTNGRLHDHPSLAPGHDRPQVEQHPGTHKQDPRTQEEKE